MRLALLVEYDGAGYHGFQYQPNARSIQEELEGAIGRLTGERVRVEGAGRTDAGVHASGQVVTFDTAAAHTEEVFLGALNHYLPRDIAVRRVRRVPAGFDPRRMATGRRYRYTIDNGPVRSPLTRRASHHVAAPLDVDRMRRAARHFLGRRDFARFAGRPERPDASTVREITGFTVRRSGRMVTLEVEGGSFLPHQVRRMAGALVDVGHGRLTPAQVKGMLNGEDTDAVAGALPPQGLCLVRVEYRDISMEEDI